MAMNGSAGGNTSDLPSMAGVFLMIAYASDPITINGAGFGKKTKRSRMQ